MIILASKSPRRKELLEMAGYDFVVKTYDVEEDIQDDNPVEYVEKTALKKGIIASQNNPEDIIISADTIVVLDDKILEKPKDKLDAYSMIKSYKGRNHHVYTGVAILYKNECINFYEDTIVSVCDLTDEEIMNYVNTDEPYDKAGAYAIQGIFGKYIEKIEGDYFNVMGLPLCAINKHLKKIL